MRFSGRVVATLVAVVLVVALPPAAISSKGKTLKKGSYAGKIRPTDASDSGSDTKIKFKVDGSGRKIKGLKAQFFYGCFIGGSFTLQSYTFPAVHKGPIKIKSNGKFSAKDVIDKDAGFVVRFSGKTKGSSRAEGKISLKTETTGNGCGRDFTWSAAHK